MPGVFTTQAVNLFEWFPFLIFSAPSLYTHRPNLKPWMLKWVRESSTILSSSQQTLGRIPLSKSTLSHVSNFSILVGCRFSVLLCLHSVFARRTRTKNLDQRQRPRTNCHTHWKRHRKGSTAKVGWNRWEDWQKRFQFAILPLLRWTATFVNGSR